MLSNIWRLQIAERIFDKTVLGSAVLKVLTITCCPWGAVMLAPLKSGVSCHVWYSMSPFWGNEKSFFRKPTVRLEQKIIALIKHSIKQVPKSETAGPVFLPCNILECWSTSSSLKALQLQWMWDVYLFLGKGMKSLVRMYASQLLNRASYLGGVAYTLEKAFWGLGSREMQKAEKGSKQKEGKIRTAIFSHVQRLCGIILP